ncbi:MAG: HEAT repeat domain-containing protein [Elusimicrobia bacterium]|nr:HEAT repeat domain-containing protein [Elusimicrobiota bacterium]
MPPLVLLLAVCFSAARAEDPPKKEPQVQRIEVPAPEAQAVASLMTQLREQGVKGLPEGWATAADLAKDPFFSALSGDPLYKDGQRSLIVEDGEFRGLLLTHEGKSFLYKPPEPFAVQAPEAGAEPKTVLKLEGGKLTPKPFSSLSDAEKRSAAAGRGRLGSFSRGNQDSGFDGGVGRGSAVFQGGKRLRAIEAAPAGASGFKAVARPAGKELPILNEYKGVPPADIKPGQLFWDGKTLMAAEGAEKGGGVRARAVGYMADMKGDPNGEVVFWHGGAEPDAKGEHPAARANWSLFYIPKVPKHFDVEGGNTTARFVSEYAMMDLRGAKEVKTAAGLRLDLASALKPFPVYKDLPPSDPAKAKPEDAPVQKPLLRYGAPQGSAGHKFQAYVDLEGWKYQEKEQDGKRYIVRTERLYNVKEPASPPDRPAPLVAPSPLPDAAPKPDRVAEFVAVLASDLSGDKRKGALDSSFAALEQALKADPSLRDQARGALASYAGGKDVRPAGRVEAAQAMLRLLPGDQKAAQAAAGFLSGVIGAEAPRYLVDAARKLDDRGLSAGLISDFEKERRALEVSAANKKAEPATPWPFPGGADPAAFEAIRLLASLKLESGDAITARTAALQAGLAHKDPLVRVAAADALATLGQYSRDARHMLAATALLDLNPDARNAAAVALPKVDPSGEKSYRLLPQFPKPPPPEPPKKKVYGPPAPPVLSQPSGAPENDLLVALKLPASDRNRAMAVDAALDQLARAAMVDPRDPWVLAVRKDLVPLLSHESPLTRAGAAGALLTLKKDGPDADAVRTLMHMVFPVSPKKDPWGRAFAVSRLGTMSKPDAPTLAALKTLVEDEGEDPSVRVQSLHTLLQLQPDDAQRLALLRKYSADKKTQMLIGAPQGRDPVSNPFQTRDPLAPFSPFPR